MLYKFYTNNVYFQFGKIVYREGFLTVNIWVKNKVSPAP